MERSETQNKVLADKETKIFNKAVNVEWEWEKWMKSPSVMPTRSFLESVEELVTAILGRRLQIGNIKSVKE